MRQRHAEKLLRELELLSVVKYDDGEMEAVPDPGYVREPAGTVRTCSNRKILGVTYKRSCSDRLVTRTVPVEGRLDDVIQKIQDFNIKVEEQVNIKELVPHGGNVVFE